MSHPIQEGQILVGPLFNEPMRVETVRPGAAGTWIAGLVGLRSERFRSVTLSNDDLRQLHGSPACWSCHTPSAIAPR